MFNVPLNCNENWSKLIEAGKVQINLQRKHFKKKKLKDTKKIWFDDVDLTLIEASKANQTASNFSKVNIKNNLKRKDPDILGPNNINKKPKMDISDIKSEKFDNELKNQRFYQDEQEFKEIKPKNHKIEKKEHGQIIINETNDKLDNTFMNNKLTKAISLDCEMVGTGYRGSESMLARVSIVNLYGQTLYDKFVKPRERVTDYRTFVSGITPDLIKNGEDFLVVQKEVCDILKDRILVGHAVHHDLKVLFLSHPMLDIRDTSKYKPFKQLFSGATPSLKKLAKNILKVDIQDGSHNSVEDAKAAMNIYLLHRKKWEASLKRRNYALINTY